MAIDQISERMSNIEVASSYVEALCVDHCKRWLPTYYIKGPISTYKNGIVLTPERSGRAMNCLFVPLSRFLIKASGRKLPIC